MSGTIIDGKASIIDGKAIIIDGKAIAAITRAGVGRAVARARAQYNIAPALAVVLVGDDGASQVYVKNKIAACHETDIQSLEFLLPTKTRESSLLAQIDTLNKDDKVHGILVQFPLPPACRQHIIIDAIAPEKDVDGLHPLNAGRLAAGLPALTACTPQGCVLLAQSVVPDLSGKHVVIIGRSNLVGKPLAQLFLRADATVTLAHSRTRNLAQVARQADILVAAAGVAGLVKGEFVQEGAVVIDVGIHRLAQKDGKSRLVGDVDFDAACARASYITPVPGGVGPMTVACLMRNSLLAACRQSGLSEAEIDALFID